MAHSRQRFSARSSKRSMLWSQGPGSSAIQSSTATGKQVWSLGQTSGGGVTLVRIRGEISMWLEVVTAIGDGFAPIGVGIGIVSSDAFGIGPTAMPGPLSDPDWDWMWVGYVGALIGESTTETFQGIGAKRIEIDTKAMRKISPNEMVFGMYETLIEMGTATVSFSVVTRMLFKLG